MSQFQIHNLAKHMQVSESYIYTLVRRGILQATNHNPIHINPESIREFYLNKIPEDLFELKHKKQLNKISITSKPYVHTTSSYFKMGGAI